MKSKSEIKNWYISIEQNGGEYYGYAIIKAAKCNKVGDRHVIADGLEIEFDELIEEPKIF